MAKKYCWYCDINLNTSQFHKCKTRSDGLQGMCKKCHKLYRSEWLTKNKLKCQKTRKEWSLKNKKRIYETTKKWRDNNREYFRKQQREYKALKRKNDPVFRITANLRNRLRKAIKGINRSKKTMELLGCDIDRFKQHIQQQFKKGMNWKNYGKWELDHIKPCCSFDLTKVEEQKLCFHYSNIQPLWKKEHRIKTQQDVDEYNSIYDF